MIEHGSDDNVITDFEQGVDAIEFLIDAFGFDDLGSLSEAEGEDTSQAKAPVRLIDVSAALQDMAEFDFGPDDDAETPSAS